MDQVEKVTLTMGLDEASRHELAVGRTIDLICAYVSNNAVAPGALPDFLKAVHAAIVGLPGPSAPAAVEAAEPQQPAVPIKKSVQADHIVCLEDGRTFKSLKRHLRAKYNLSPEQYRAKWGLSPDYPMVAPNYAKARSDLAKAIGLGRGAAAETDAGSAPEALAA